MKVVYDTSVLGFGQYQQTGRTGVFRVVENQAKELARIQDCDLFFSGSECFQMWTHAKAFLEQHPELYSIPRLSYGSIAASYQSLYRLMRSLGGDRKASLPIRAARRSLNELLSLIDKNFLPLSAKNLSGKDVFHSPFWALPPQTKGIAKLHRILTIHDIIGILHPEFITDGGTFLRSIVASVSPEDWVICVSEATRTDLLNFRPDLNPNRVSVVYSAASELFTPCHNVELIETVKRRYGLSDRLYFLSVCTLEPRKNMEHLIRSFDTFIKEQGITDLDLVLVGAPADSAAAIRALIENLPAAKKHVIQAGFVQDEDLSPLYSGALAFVYPSLLEGFGLPPLEAMHCGIPVITSNTSSLPEVVGDAAKLVDPRDTEDLCDALWEVYKSRDLRDRMGVQSLQRARLFSWKNSAEGLMSVYRRATSL